MFWWGVCTAASALSHGLSVRAAEWDICGETEERGSIRTATFVSILKAKGKPSQLWIKQN